jgi:hypothetical protein
MRSMAKVLGVPPANNAEAPVKEQQASWRDRFKPGLLSWENIQHVGEGMLQTGQKVADAGLQNIKGVEKAGEDLSHKGQTALDGVVKTATSELNQGHQIFNKAVHDGQNSVNGLLKSGGEAVTHAQDALSKQAHATEHALETKLDHVKHDLGSQINHAQHELGTAENVVAHTPQILAAGAGAFGDSLVHSKAFTDSEILTMVKSVVDLGSQMAQSSWHMGSEVLKDIGNTRDAQALNKWFNESEDHQHVRTMLLTGDVAGVSAWAVTHGSEAADLAGKVAKFEKDLSDVATTGQKTFVGSVEKTCSDPQFQSNLQEVFNDIVVEGPQDTVKKFGTGVTALVQWVGNHREYVSLLNRADTDPQAAKALQDWPKTHPHDAKDLMDALTAVGEVGINFIPQVALLNALKTSVSLATGKDMDNILTQKAGQPKSEAVKASDEKLKEVGGQLATTGLAAGLKLGSMGLNRVIAKGGAGTAGLPNEASGVSGEAVPAAAVGTAEVAMTSSKAATASNGEAAAVSGASAPGVAESAEAPSTAPPNTAAEAPRSTAAEASKPASAEGQSNAEPSKSESSESEPTKDSDAAKKPAEHSEHPKLEKAREKVDEIREKSEQVATGLELGGKLAKAAEAKQAGKNEHNEKVDSQDLTHE